MEPIKLEVLIPEDGLEGLNSLTSGMEQLNTSIQQQSALVLELEQQLVALKAAFEEATAAGYSQEQNLEVISLLQEELMTLKSTLYELRAQFTAVAEGAQSSLQGVAEGCSTAAEEVMSDLQEVKETATVVAEETKESLQKVAEDITAAAGEVKEGLQEVEEGVAAMAGASLNDLQKMEGGFSVVSEGVNVATNAAELFGVEQEVLTKIQMKLQNAMAITQSLQRIANILTQQGIVATKTMTGSTGLLTVATRFLGDTFGWVGVKAQVALAACTMGLSLVIAALVAAWHFFSSKEDEAEEARRAQEEAAREQSETEKRQRESAAQTVVSQMVEYKKLQKAYKELGGDMKKQKQFVEDNKEAFERLGFSVSGVQDAENLLIQGEDAFVQTITRRALIAASMEVAAEKYKLAITTMMEADGETEKNDREARAQRVARLRLESRLKKDNKSSDSHTIDTILQGKGAADYEGWMVEYTVQHEKMVESSRKTFEKEAKNVAKEIAQVHMNAGDSAIQTVSDYLVEEGKAFEENGLKRSGGKKKISNASAAIQKKKADVEKDIQKKQDEAEAKVPNTSGDKYEQRTNQVESDFEKKKKEILAWQENILAKIEKENLYSGDELTNITNKINKAAEDAIKKADGERKTETTKINADKLKERKELEYNVKVNSAEGAAKRLLEIEHKYDNLLEKVKDYGDLEKEVESTKGREIEISNKKEVFEGYDRAEQEELHRQDILYKGLKMDEYVAQERNKITEKYINLRLAVLKGMTDEQSLRETEKLTQERDRLNGENARPKSLKGMFDEKAMGTLKKHYMGLGDSATVAEEKAKKFAIAFQDSMQLSSEVVGTLKTAFGGLDEGLDGAMNAVGSVVDGFANGGLVGGIAAAAGQVISITANLVGAKKEMDAGMVAHYETFMSVLNEMVDKQISMLDKLGGDQFGTNIAKTTKDIQSGIVASRKLLAEAASSGSSAGSHSYGYKANETLAKYRKQLREAGIYKTKWNEMSNEELIKLRSLPEIYAHLPESMRKYIDAIAEGANKLEEFNEEVQNTILGFEFSDITSMIVDSFTDSSIDDALGNLTQNVNGAIANIVKNMLARKMLTGPIQDLVDNLFKSMDKGNNKYELNTKDAKGFVDGVKTLGEQYGQAWGVINESFKNAGIDFDAQNAESQSAKAGSFTTMSQEQGTKLEGLFTSLQDHTSSIDYTVIDISRTMYAASDKLSEIARNTSYCVHLEQMAGDISELKRDGIKMK